MVRVGQAGGVHEVGVGQAQLLRGGVHHVGEGVFAAGDMLGQGDAGVVAGLDDDAMQQVAHRDLAADLDEHPRTAGAPGMFADGDQVVLADAAGLDLLGGDVGGHQFGQAGRRQALVAVVLDQNLAALAVHQDVRLGGQLRRRRNHGFSSPASRRGDEQDKQ